MNVTINSILIRDNEPTAVALDDGDVVFSMRAGAYFGFNRVATEIWRMLAEPCRVCEIFERLTELYDVDDETLARDVTPFLKTLVEQRLVRMIEPGGVR